jgi:hypothetical protein
MEASMVLRDVSRSWGRNRRRLVRDRNGRLLGSTRIVLSAIQVRAVERMFRTGRSLEAIADAIGVCRNTIQRILRDQLQHVPRRKRSWMDVQRREDPSPDELRQQMADIRGS